MAKQGERKKVVTVTFVHDGKRYYCRAETASKAAKKAEERKKKLEHDIPAGGGITVNQWFERYMEIYKTGAGDKTREDYRSLYKNAIAPYIGPMTLKSVRAIHCQGVCNRLAGKSLSYCRKARLLLIGIFETAADNDYIEKNPARKVMLPDAEDGERRALTKAERKAFLNAAGSLGQRGLFFLVIYYCGLRPSEVARMQYEDIDRTSRTLRVRGTKTKAAVRRVPLPDALQIPEGEGLVFTTYRSYSAPTKKAVQYWWKKLLAEMEKISGTPAAEDLTPYCLRHDFCTRMQEADVAIDVARRIMGHSSIEITSRAYTHDSDEAFLAAAEKINNYNSGGKKPPVRKSTKSQIVQTNADKYRLIRLVK